MKTKNYILECHMNISYRQVNIDNPDEVRFISEMDVRIPAQFDSDFLVNEKTVKERINHFKEKFNSDDFFEIATDNTGKIIGFHAVKKLPYFNLSAGNVY